MAILGLRSVADFTLDGQRPKNWREGILKLYPNGKAPLTALTSLMKSRSVDDPEFSWYERELTDRRFVLSASITTVGQTTLVCTAARDVQELHLGNILLVEETGEQIRVAQDPANATDIVVERGFAGTTAATLTITTAGKNPNLLVIGSAFEEGSLPPAGVQIDPSKVYNLTQIFRQTLEFTRTATKTRLRTGDQVKQAKEDALEMLSMDMERGFLFGERFEGTKNGKPIRTMRGIIPTLRLNAGSDGVTGSNIITAGSTTTLATFEGYLERAFRFGSSEKVCFCGNSFLLAMQQIIRRNSAMQIMSGIKEYGMNVMRVTTAFGDLVLKSHPLFNNNGGGITNSTAYYGMTNWGLIVDMKNLQYVNLKDSDISYQKELQANGLDGEKSGYLGEVSLETHFAKSHMLIKHLVAPAVDT